MHVHFEENETTRSDCAIQGLSWMGKVPETLPDEDGWKLNRLHYYQEGWLASGNHNGIIGVTFTACHCKKNFEQPPRTNFNLRGHRNEVALVKWNEPYQKLATCDITGVIFVWIKHEGRWSIELINDRNSQVTDFAWSHDGRMALICYRDGFVLVGSVAGQRYWSSMLNLDGCTITCGIWSPDDAKVLFGTTDGQVIVMSANGAMLAQVTLVDGTEITGMAWSCEKFYLDERDNNDNDNVNIQDEKNYTLAVCFKTGIIYLLFNYDDVCPRIIHTGLTGVKMEWCNDGEILAVTGFVRLPNLDCKNELRFYTPDGHLRYSITIPHLGKPVTALTWGHNNKRLFVAVGCYIYTAWVTRKVALLQFLCRRAIQKVLKDDSMVSRLPLPTKLRGSISALFSPTVKGYIPDPLRLREFVCMPPPGSERLHCTMIRHGEETSGGHYMLYLEYLGGLIPLLKGKRASKIRPEFVVFDPKIKTGTKADEEDIFISSESASSESDLDQDVVVEGCGSPRMQRKKRLKKLRQRIERRDSTASQRPLDELLYDDNLPETHKLLEVTSNLWGTKFKLHGLPSFLPEDLGQVLYKTSLLHLQPRQMTVSLLELTPDLPAQARDPSYNPNQFSESDDDVSSRSRQNFHERLSAGTLGSSDEAIPISPEVYGNQPAKISRGSTETTLPGAVDNGAIEVPVIIERHSVFQNKPERSVSNCSPFEIRSLDGSPPQRRSPSLKSRSLSPAEHQVTYTSNTLVDGGPDGDMFTREMYIEKNTKICMSTIYNLNNTEAGVSTNTTGQVEVGDVALQASPCSVVHLAAKRLEDVLAKQRLTGHNDSGSFSLTQEQCGSQLLKSTSSSDNGTSFLRHSSNSSDGQSPPVEATVRADMHRVSMIDYIPPSQTGPPARWADKACQEIKYIDDDPEDTTDNRKESKEAVFCTVDGMTAREIMTSTQMLAELDQSPRASHYGTDLLHQSTIGGGLSNAANSIELHKKRLVLAPPVDNKEKDKKSLRAKLNKELQNARNSIELISRCERKLTGVFTDESPSSSRSESPRTSSPPSPVLERQFYENRRGSLDIRRLAHSRDSSVEGPDPPAIQSTSLPTSPVRRIVMPQQKKSRSKQDISMNKSKMYSPFLKRRFKNYKAVDSSDEEILLSGDDVTTSENYKNLETFQKAQLNKKLRKVRTHKPEEGRDSVRRSPSLPRKRHFVMHNKAPLWNENSQVYQLDFGGRVTQESAKNFQIEFRGKQVMQFGRIDGNAYTLDFQYPFSAIQAFAVALANVTQRLK